MPTLQTDQLNVVAHHLNALKTKEDNHVAKDIYHEFWGDPMQWPDPIDKFNISKLTRRKIFNKQPDDVIEKFVQSEYKQLDRYLEVDMFGEPCLPPPDKPVLPWVWTYLFKENPLTGIDEPKSRGTCDGSTKRNGIVTLEETYAACVDQTAHRLTWALLAALDLMLIGYDVGNAFAEAAWQGNDNFYMEVDLQFQNWWVNHLKREPIPLGYVIPIKHALQGHKRAPRLWDKHISKIIIDEMGFKATTHEPCLYYKHDGVDGLVLICRQVDDFAVAGKDPLVIDKV